jgi:predicted RNase H-like HicB family nuclease
VEPLEIKQNPQEATPTGMNLQVVFPNGNRYNPHKRKEKEMILDYISKAMNHAKYEILPDDNTFYGEIPECNGVYANAVTLEECRNQLSEVLEEWLVFRIHRNLPVPVIEGMEIVIKQVA